MKKIIALLLCMFLLAVSLVACGNKDEGEETSDTAKQSVEQSESETEEDEEDYTVPSFEETDPPKVEVEEMELGDAGEDGEGDWSGYYPKN